MTRQTNLHLLRSLAAGSTACPTADRETSELLQDHWELADALLARRVQDAEQIVRPHLGRLDETIRAIREEQAEFFED